MCGVRDILVGSIIEVNSRLEDEPEIVTEDSMGEGWFIKVKLSDPAELDELMDEESNRGTPAQERERLLAQV